MSLRILEHMLSYLSLSVTLLGLVCMIVFRKRLKMKHVSVFLAVLSVTLLLQAYWNPTVAKEKKHINKSAVLQLEQDTNMDIIYEDLENIAVVRVVDTPALEAVRRYVVASLKSLGKEWEIEEDSFIDDTPMGPKHFTNVIATFNPRKFKNRLVFAAHIDSKYFPEPNRFVAAHDSAVSCAILLDLARSIQEQYKSGARVKTGLQLVFFDGEEAFKEWTRTDSLYGARHLAAKWEALSPSQTPLGSDETGGESPKRRTFLSTISCFILLDLVGDGQNRFVSFFKNTFPRYRKLQDVETTLREMGLLRRDEAVGPYFSSHTRRGGHISDDHEPFLEKGVPIVHLIAYPFPKTWHTEEDNLQHIDPQVVHDFSVMIKVFALRELGMM